MLNANDYDLLATALTNAYVAGRKSGYLFGLEDSALDMDEVEKRIDYWFGRDEEEPS